MRTHTHSLSHTLSHVRTGRYRYADLPGIADTTRATQASNAADPLVREAAELSKSAEPRFPRPFRGDPAVDDAFATIIQWLHSRIPDTR